MEDAENVQPRENCLRPRLPALERSGLEFGEDGDTEAEVVDGTASDALKLVEFVQANLICLRRWGCGGVEVGLAIILFLGMHGSLNEHFGGCPQRLKKEILLINNRLPSCRDRPSKS